MPWVPGTQQIWGNLSSGHVVPYTSLCPVSTVHGDEDRIVKHIRLVPAFFRA